MNKSLQQDERYKFSNAKFDMQALMMTNTTGLSAIAEAFLLKETASGISFEILHCLPADMVALPLSVGCQTEVVFAGEEPVMVLGKDKYGNGQVVLSKDSVVSVTYVSGYKNNKKVKHRKIYTTVL